jgi:hypothetical protein
MTSKFCSKVRYSSKYNLTETCAVAERHGQLCSMACLYEITNSKYVIKATVVTTLIIIFISLVIN